MSDPALISIHMPLAGHDLFSDDRAAHVGISIHMPLAGHDGRPTYVFCWPTDFNPRAPCGARHHVVVCCQVFFYFNPRAPCGARRGSAGADHAARSAISIHVPLAGHDLATLCKRHHEAAISIHVPLAGHDCQLQSECAAFEISIHVPLAGHDIFVRGRGAGACDFNPRAPCGARPHSVCQRPPVRREISIHVPLAGHDLHHFYQ